ncbi:hypothetical protein SDB20_01885 [Legionella pneumophila serogroup 1]
MTLDKDKTDSITAMIKGVFGTVPYIGSILSEVFCQIIPNQRIDRVAQFAKELDKRVTHLEQDKLKLIFKSPEFIHLLEDSIVQVTRARSEQRISYIATLLAKGVSEKEIEYYQIKKYLDLLTELIDIEVIILGSFIRKKNKNPEYYEIHRKILTTNAFPDLPREKRIEEESIQKSYFQHLVQLGLLTQRVELNEKTKIPIFSNNGMPKIKGYAITILGRKLLNYIDAGTIN